MIDYLTPDMCKMYRKANDISLEELSERVGMTKQAMSNFERNHEKMSKNAVKKNCILYTLALLDCMQESVIKIRKKIIPYNAAIVLLQHIWRKR